MKPSLELTLVLYCTNLQQQWPQHIDHDDAVRGQQPLHPHHPQSVPTVMSVFTTIITLNSGY